MIAKRGPGHRDEWQLAALGTTVGTAGSGDLSTSVGTSFGRGRQRAGSGHAPPMSMEGQSLRSPMRGVRQDSSWSTACGGPSRPVRVGDDLLRRALRTMGHEASEESTKPGVDARADRPRYRKVRVPGRTSKAPGNRPPDHVSGSSHPSGCGEAPAHRLLLREHGILGCRAGGMARPLRPLRMAEAGRAPSSTPLRGRSGGGGDDRASSPQSRPGYHAASEGQEGSNTPSSNW